MAHVQTKGYALAITGALWFGAVLFVILSNTIVRETPLGVIAQAMDKLPSTLGNVLFLACWCLFLLGWIPPVFFSVRLLIRSHK